jgi:putative nucleotidyltransferase-like protein
VTPLERRVLLGLVVDPPRLAPRDIANPDVRWARLHDVVVRHGVAPLVARGLRALGRVAPLPTAAAALRDRCHALHVQNVARNTQIFAEIERVLAPLRRAGIPVILLKGAALARPLFGDIGLRYMGEVDLLVEESARAHALGILRGLGYHLVPGAPADLRAQARRAGIALGPEPLGAEQAAGLYERYHFHYYLERDGQSFPLELHWHIVKPGRGVEIDDLWREARPARVGDVDALCLRPEHLLLHLALHLTMDDWPRIRRAGSTCIWPSSVSRSIGRTCGRPPDATMPRGRSASPSSSRGGCWGRRCPRRARICSRRSSARWFPCSRARGPAARRPRAPLAHACARWWGGPCSAGPDGTTWPAASTGGSRRTPRRTPGCRTATEHRS